MDRMQNRMIASMTREVRYPGEELGQYVRRRNQMASRLAGEHGRWSRLWANRLCTWRAHLLRERNEHVLVARVYIWRGAEYLRERRLQRGSLAVAGRTNTRLPQNASVLARWEEGCNVAHTHVK